MVLSAKHHSSLTEREINANTLHTDAGRGLDKKQSGNNYTSKVKVGQKYNIIGFISSGTYGRVYKAVEKNPKSDPSSPVGATPNKELFAIKK